MRDRKMRDKRCWKMKDQIAVLENAELKMQDWKMRDCDTRNTQMFCYSSQKVSRISVPTTSSAALRCSMEQYSTATFTEGETDDMCVVCLLVAHAGVALVPCGHRALA